MGSQTRGIPQHVGGSQTSACTHLWNSRPVDRDIQRPGRAASPDENHAKGFKPYVKCELHVEKPEERLGEPIPGGGKSKEGEYKQRTKTVKGQDPDFDGEVLRFEGVPGVAPELSFVR